MAVETLHDSATGQQIAKAIGAHGMWKMRLKSAIDSEAKALGVSQLLFGKPALFGFPMVVVDSIVVILPLNVLFIIIVSLFTSRQDSRFLDKLFKK